MNIITQRFAKLFFLAGMLMAVSVTAVNAGESKESILNKYQSNGFQCLDISQTINEDTLKSYTDLVLLEDSDKVHVCVRMDMTQRQIAGNKYVFVFDKDGGMKTFNQIPSFLD